jgi:7,8-didemethyl-8-hydroxy-5-deazariboflavin synthase CofG subunit
MISFVEETDNLFSSEQVYSSFKSHGVEVDMGKPLPGKLEKIFQDAHSLGSINREQALSLANLKTEEMPYLLIVASKVRDRGKGRTLSFSKNIFLPLTRLCRDHCGYCTFKIEPQEGQLLVPPDEVKEMARKGAQLGCTELLFVTGDKPELAYPVYRDALRKIGYKTTAEYLIAMCEAGLWENIFPHSNLGLATKDELQALRESNPSMGLMLENISPRLLKKGQAHYRSADKVPKLRMRTMELAGELRIAWTSGILVGIGETWEERIDSLYALKNLSDEYGHIQEIIIQNFSPKHGIIMQNYPPPSFMEMLKTVAISRLIFGENMNIQIPPNLNPHTYPLFIFAGINDLGGVSPVTIDYVNPEAPWPQITNMTNICDEVAFKLEERLPVYPEFINEEFISKAVLERVHNFVDKRGFVLSQEAENGTN